MLPARTIPSCVGETELIMVGKFGPDGQEEVQKTARAVFEHHRVKLHTFGNLEPLIAEIRHFAHR